MKTRSVSFPFALLRFWARRILPIWAFIGSVIFLMQLAVCAIVHDNASVQTFLKFLDIMPSFVKTALGGDLLQSGNVPGLILIGYQHPFVLFLYLLFAVGVPTTLLTGEVQRGTMELILSRPATKSQVYVCACVITLAGMFALVPMMFLGTVTATNIYDFGQPIPLDLFFRVAVNGGLVAGASGSLALLAAGALSVRNRAVTASVAFLVLNYFAWIVAQWWPRFGFLKPVTLFFYSSNAKLAYGWPLGDMGVLVLLILAASTIGGVIWQRRDLPL